MEKLPNQKPEQSPSPAIIRQALEASGSGYMLEGMEKPVHWAQAESEALADAAVNTAQKSPDDPTIWSRLSNKVSRRVIMTGLAMATVMPMLAPNAEAGERGRNRRRAGTIISIVAGVGEQVLAHKQDKHRRQARHMEYQLRVLENEGEHLIRRIERINDNLATLHARLDQEDREQRRTDIRDDIKRREIEKANLIVRAQEINSQIQELGPELQREIESEGKAGLFADIADIAREQADWARRGY